MQYKAFDGQVVKLNGNIVRRYLDKGGKMTGEEANFAVAFCRAHQLDPFRGDVSFIKYDVNKTPSIVISHAHVLRRASSNPKYSGFQSGVVVQKDGEMECIIGGIAPQGATLVGGWCDVYMDGYPHPISMRLPMGEYNKGQATWKAMPTTMIIKCAEVASHRKACSAELGGLYTNEEMTATNDSTPKKQWREEKPQEVVEADVVEKIEETIESSDTLEEVTEGVFGKVVVEDVADEHHEDEEMVAAGQLPDTSKPRR